MVRNSGDPLAAALANFKGSPFERVQTLDHALRKPFQCRAI
jgi:hypothetical protein